MFKQLITDILKSANDLRQRITFMSWYIQEIFKSGSQVKKYKIDP